MKQVDWYYRRKGCKTCAKADAFLAQHEVEVSELVDCKKYPMSKGDVQLLLAGVTQVLAARGSTVRSFQSPCDQGEVLVAIMGPTGNLRAPTLRQGKRLYVGYDVNLYGDLVQA